VAGANRRIAVVLFNLGGPDRPEAVRPFLFNLFNDPAILRLPTPVRTPLAALISRLRERTAKANYRLMGVASPLLAETGAQADALQEQLAAVLPGTELRTFVAMRYWSPLTEEAARAVEAFAPEDVVLLPLYPQFSTTTTGSSLIAWRDAFQGSATVRTVRSYPVEPGLVDGHVRRIEEAWSAAGKPAPVRLLFSAHGLPEKIVERGDPYPREVEATARAVAARLGESWDWKVCYQSRVGPMKWLGPSTLEAIAESVREGLGVLISPISFVSEHVETLVELDHDYAKAAKAMGCRAYVRAPALGTEPRFIAALAHLTEEALGREAA
jgi:ferrochelatase